MADDVRLTHRHLTDVEAANIADIKVMGAAFLGGISALPQTPASGRALALARTKVEEAVMWAVKGITG